MAATVIGTVTSRLRGMVKAHKQDAQVTDRFLYSIWKKYASVAIKRMDIQGRLLPFSSVFETLDMVELEDVDFVEAAACVPVKSYRTLKRTKLAMPMFTEGAYGPLVRSITSLDGSVSFTITTMDTWYHISKSKNYRYDTTKYCWFINDRLYFPDTLFPMIRVEGVFEEDISAFTCCGADRCKPRQEQSLNVPDYLIADIEQMVLRDLGIIIQIPTDTVQDNVNIAK
jgi:hypothetical protein